MSRRDTSLQSRPAPPQYLLAAFALLLVITQAGTARAQWTQPDASGNISNTNTTGNVGVGTAAPAARLDIKSSTSDATAAAVGVRNAANANLFFIRNDGRVGIGTTNPAVSLHIATESIAQPRGVLIQQSNTGNNSAFLVLRKSRGTIAAPTVIANGDPLGAIYSEAYDGSAYLRTGANIKFVSNGPVAIGSIPTDITFNTGLSGLGTEQMRITSAGSVGIGTATPSARLHLYSGGNTYLRIGAPLAYQSSIAFSDDTYGQDIVLYRPEGTRDFSLWTATAGQVLNVAQGGNVSASGSLSVAGTITGGNIQAKYQDVAEWVRSTEKLPAGTVVVLDPRRANQVISSSEAYDTKVAGVVSAQPGIALGEGGEGKLLVATTGRVKVRVDATRAPVQIGDLLVTGDRPGVAMKSEPISVGGRKMHAPGTIIGKALEPLEGGTGDILVLLSLQ